MAKSPFENLRVIDSTYVFAMPYAGGILGDMGAEVIKIEGPGHLDIVRGGQFSGGFPDNDPGEDYWNRSASFNLLNRNKKSLTLDLSKEECREYLKELISISDVMMENYTPRVMKRWGLDYENIKKIKPDLILISNTGYGHGEGPFSAYPAQATTQEATHGHCYITGYNNDIPSKAGASYVDFLACWSGLFAVASALRHRNKTGKGQWIDIGMYQLGVMGTAEYIMDWQSNQNKSGRFGNRHPWRTPQGTYPCDGVDQWVVLSIGEDSQWGDFCEIMEKPELASDEKFATLLNRRQHHDEIDQIISEWTKTKNKYEIMELLQGKNIPCGPVFDSADCNLNPHYQERGFIERVEYPEFRNIGTRKIMGRPWRGSKLDARVRAPIEPLGSSNSLILQDLIGMSDTDFEDFKTKGFIAEEPSEKRVVPTSSLAEQVQAGRLAYFDADYKRKLGI
tara:strand:- start:5990 stop:7342 length:1353 start_codon:yes stop_codon:yes gene_type:complete